VIDKRTVFVLGAGASCPYGYPSGARLRERICLSEGFWQDYQASRQIPQVNIRLQHIQEFKERFNKSRIKSIDLFMAKNPKLASMGKYIIAFEIFRAEQRSCFGEEAQLQKEQIADLQRHGKRGVSQFLSLPVFQGGDWYSYLYNRLMGEALGKNDLPDFSNGNLAFVTFNYDRSLEHFLYEGLCNLFEGDLHDEVLGRLKQLRILHVYGQIAPLKWQDSEKGVDYHAQITESLLQSASSNIRTIYEEKENPELIEAQNLLKQAREIFFLGFGYARENMSVLNLPASIPQNCWVYGTAFGGNNEEVKRIRKRIVEGLLTDPPNIKGEIRINIEPTDCLELLRNHLD